MVKGIAGNVASGGCAKWELDRREEPNVDTSFQWVAAVCCRSNQNKGNCYWQVQMIESQSESPADVNCHPEYHDKAKHFQI